MSILSTEFDLDAAKRVYAEERVEDKLIEIAQKLLRRNRPIEEIMEDTGLSRKEIENLRASAL